jgi:lysophospholipase L1-like esterase
VGSLAGQGCGFEYDGEHDGHGGYLITGIQNGDYPSGDGPFDSWLSIAQPDIVLLHMGTNDAWSGIATEKICAGYTWALEKIRAQNPNVYILIAQIIPLSPREFDCPDCPDRVVELDAAIVEWAKKYNTANSPIVAVDQWTGFDTTTDTYDGVHPNDAGIEKVAAGWLKPLETAIRAKSE